MTNNEELNLAWQLVQNTGCNVFLTGKAGTGKTTFLREFYAQTSKRAVVLAPTGIAAINAGGSTLHSFFQLPFGPYIPGTNVKSGDRSFKFSDKKRRLIRSLDLVIIDEISMVRADLLDSVDNVLRPFRDRTKPFGGVQLLMIGDLQQLAPVAKPEEWAMLQPYYDTQYFFSSRSLKEAGYVTVELKRVYRQSEQTFVDLLNKVRNNEIDAHVLQQLNSRYVPGFKPNADPSTGSGQTQGYIRLVTHNRQADSINEQEMNALDAEPHTYHAEVWREFPELSYPTFEALTLKVGAQVMFVKNDSSIPRHYFNGMLGTVASMTDNVVNVMPHNGGQMIAVTPEQWENTRYNLNEKTKDIEEELLGTFTQFPLKPAWAITVHKSQGLTFERAIIDVQYSFSHGQTYVALSRCKSLEGIVLASMIPAHAIITDNSVVSFTRSIPQQIPDSQKVEDLKRDYYVTLLAELFTFHRLRNAIDAYQRHIEEWLSRQCPMAIADWKNARADFEKQVHEVSRNFSVQYQRIVYAGYDYDKDEHLQERCRKGAEWFSKALDGVAATLRRARISTGNKAVAEREEALRADLKDELTVKLKLLKYVQKNGFSPENYMHERALATLGSDAAKKKKTGSATTKTATKRSAAQHKAMSYEDVLEDMNSYDAYELREVEIDYPDLAHEGLPY
ncbi:MAG: AAA family ATPase [Bacteroidales bacterium]|nr:AAA family ATPase [Bacteroidales bacterium]